MKTHSVTYQQIIYLLLFFIFQSSSFDIFLNLRIGGFSFRVVYIIIIILFIVYLFESFKLKKFVVRLLGLKPFLIWSFFLIIFIPNVPLMGRSVGYLLWLYIHFVFIVCCEHFLKEEKVVHQVIRLYLFSFLVCSLFGFLQFAMGLFGYNLLLEQWWIEGSLPRLNGFSYEPSYYSTYLIIGFSLCYYIYRKGVVYYGKLPYYVCLATFLAIFLSSSRMGIMVALLQILCFEVINNRKHIKKLVIFILSFVFLVGGLILYIIQNENLSFLLAGLGIMGGSAYSSLERLDGFMTQINILSRNPFKGYSLGGVSQAIALEKGVTNMSQETIKQYDLSINIFLEVLTASGVIGFIAFLYYIYILLIHSTAIIRSCNYFKQEGLLLNALVWSLLFELIILCFNQTILRAYLWVHIGLLNGVYFYIKYKVLQKTCISNP